MISTVRYAVHTVAYFVFLLLAMGWIWRDQWAAAAVSLLLLLVSELSYHTHPSTYVIRFGVYDIQTKEAVDVDFKTHGTAENFVQNGNSQLKAPRYEVIVRLVKCGMRDC